MFFFFKLCTLKSDAIARISRSWFWIRFMSLISLPSLNKPCYSKGLKAAMYWDSRADHCSSGMIPIDFFFFKRSIETGSFPKHLSGSVLWNIPTLQMHNRGSYSSAQLVHASQGSPVYASPILSSCGQNPCDWAKVIPVSILRFFKSDICCSDMDNTILV